MTVIHDAFGEECKKMVEDLTSEKKPPPLPPLPKPTPPATSTSFAEDNYPPPHFRTTESEFGSASSDSHYSRSRKPPEDGEENWDHYEYGKDATTNNNRDKIDEFGHGVEDHRHYRYDKKDSRKWDKEKKHHHYHHKSDKERDRRERDHHRSHRDRDRERDYDKVDRDRRDRRDTKYRDSYKKPLDRDYNSSTDMGYGGKMDGGYGHLQPPLPHHTSYDTSYDSGYHAYPPVPPSTPPAYPPPPTHPPYPTNSIPPIPPWQPAWQEPPVAPPPAEEDWDKEVIPSKEPDWDEEIAAKSTKNEKTENEKPKSECKVGEEEDQSTIDLDTRIALMFKEKSFGAAPPFLQLDDSESESEKDPEHKGKIKKEPKDGSKSDGVKGEFGDKHNKKAKKDAKICIDDDASDISSDDDLLLNSPDQNKTIKTEEDKMSLSSLSSNGEIEAPIVPPLPAEPMSLAPEYFYLPGTDPYYYANGTQAYGQYQNQYMPSSGYMQPYVSGFSALIPGNYMQQDYTPRRSEPKSSEPKYDPCEETITAVTDRVTNELKYILKKDFNKKMIENTAYKTFESWWDEQSRSKTKIVEAPVVEKLSKIPDINEALTKSRTAENYENSNGFGFRTQILKLPRFQRIRKPPSPVHQDEDSKKGLSDQEEMVQGSESENEDVPPPSKVLFNENRKAVNEPKIAKPKAPSESSFFTSSSEDESSSESESESDSSSLSEIEELPKVEKARDRERKIYSDSDSDEEIKTLPPKSTPTNKAKLRLYSDTLSEDESEPKAQISKPAVLEKVKTPEPSGDNESSQSPKPPRTPGRESPAKKSSYDYARIYSDSDEEREYQEKRRRNTEYMEQIERELKEEMLLHNEHTPTIGMETAEDDEPLPEKAPSPGDPITPLITKPPPTPGATIVTDPLSELAQSKASSLPAKKKTLSDVKKKDIAGKKLKDINGISHTRPVDDTPLLSETDDDNQAVKLSPASSDGGSSQESQTSQASQVALEHCYSLPPSKSPSVSSPFTQIPEVVVAPTPAGASSDVLAHDHGYTSSTSTSVPPITKPNKKKESAPAKKAKKGKVVPEIVEKNEVVPFVPEQKYEEYSEHDKMLVMYEFLTKGIDAEDIEYMRRSYEYLLQDDANSCWLNATHWKDHCVTDRSMLPPPSKKRKKDDELKKHVSGCARAEGFYKLDIRDKMRFKFHQSKLQSSDNACADAQAKMVSKMQGASREARSNQRRLLTAFGASTESELLKFNQLKFRKKQLKFAKSAIHDWGLFAMEPIAADEMVIEYVGQMIRPVVADSREAKYEAIGIGSSYLFRIDVETIIDATKCGNLARFINHSCNVSICTSSIKIHDVTVSLSNLFFFFLFTLQHLFYFSQTVMQKSSPLNRRRKL